MKFFLKQFIQILLLPFTVWLFLYRTIRSRKKLSYISIHLSGSLSETPPSGGLLHLLRPPEPRYYDTLLGLYVLERSLRKKRFRKEVKSILVHIDAPDVGWGRAWELREQLRKIAASGVEIWAFLHSGDRLSYYIASGCPAIAAAPANSIELFGLSSEQLFYKGAFDRLGIKPNFISVGDYKSAAETYTRKNSSPQAKQQIKEVINAIHEEIKQAIVERTGAPSLKSLQQKALLTADEAFENKLIDAVMYPEQLEFGLTRNTGIKYVPCETALKVIRWRQTRLLDWRKTTRIALIVGEGAIVDSEESMPNAISLFDYEPAVMSLKQAGYQAIVYRWNSPGGSAYASDILWQRIMSAGIDSPFPYLSGDDPFIRKPAAENSPMMPEEKKRNNRRKTKAAHTPDEITIEVREMPVYVSMSDVAASGGYYLSAVSKRVFASPLTITGSIGVVGGKFNVSGLLKKVGVSFDSVTAGENGNIFSPLTDFSPAQKKIILNNMEHMYKMFRNRITLARGLSEDEILASAGGRIFSGKEATRRKLVDATASLTDIFEIIRADLKLKDNDKVSIAILPQIKAPLFPKSLAALPFLAQWSVWRSLEREYVFTLDMRLF